MAGGGDDRGSAMVLEIWCRDELRGYGMLVRTIRMLSDQGLITPSITSTETLRIRVIPVDLAAPFLPSLRRPAYPTAWSRGDDPPPG